MDTVIDKGDVKTIVAFISSWEKIEDPKLADICSLLQSLGTDELRSWMLGLCRVNNACTELLKRSVQISLDCLMQEAGQRNTTAEEDCEVDKTLTGPDSVGFLFETGGRILGIS